MNKKPPLGVIPEYFWNQQRIIELANAILRYIENESYDNFNKTINCWCDELKDLISKQDRLQNTKK